MEGNACCCASLKRTFAAPAIRPGVSAMPTSALPWLHWRLYLLLCQWKATYACSSRSTTSNSQKTLADRTAGRRDGLTLRVPLFGCWVMGLQRPVPLPLRW